MKRILFSFIAFSTLCVFAQNSPITIKPGLSFTQENGTYTIQFSMPDYSIVTDTLAYNMSIPNLNDPNTASSVSIEDIFSKLQPYCMDRFDYVTEDGRPELPFYSLNLILSDDATYFQVTNVNIIDSTIIQLDYDYVPAQNANNFIGGYSYDDTYYSNFNNTWYWMYYTIDSIQYRQYPGFVFSIFPCHYEPSTRSLIIINHASFEISFDGSSIPSSDNIAANLDLGAINFFHNFSFWNPSNVPSINGDEYLIIADYDLVKEEELIFFKDHKENLGYNVSIVSVNDVGNTPAQIRAYIKDLYMRNHLKFVLLVGDPHNVPFFEGDSADYDNPPSDLYYSCLSKDDVSDQSDDLSPSVYIGRWPVKNTNELENVVFKTIASDLYLGDGLTNYGSFRIGLFSGSDNSCSYNETKFYKTFKYIYDHIVQGNNRYSGDLIDGRDPNTCGQTMIDYIISSYDPTWMFIYDGHGAVNGIASPYNIHSSYISSYITNLIDFQSFGFGISCWLGNVYYPDNFAHPWVTSEQGGVTFLGATTESSINENMKMFRKMFDQLEMYPMLTIGEFVGNGIAKYYNSNKTNKKLLQAKRYVLYGDPSLYLCGLDITTNTPIDIMNLARNAQQPNNNGKNFRIKGNKLQVDTQNVENVTSVQIYSISGILLRSECSYQLDLQGLSPGIYILIINTKNKQISKKIIL